MREITIWKDQQSDTGEVVRVPQRITIAATSFTLYHYTRAFGRGCATCHDVQPNPNLFESVNKLSKEEFTKVLVEGRNAMPKAMDQIMNLGPVKSAGLTQDQAVDSLIAYLKAGKK